MVNKDFLKYIGYFDLVMSRFGYIRSKEGSVSSKLYKAHLTVQYVNEQIHRSLNIDYTEWNTSKILISMTMYDDIKENTFFSLFDFLDGHKLRDKIKSEVFPDEDFEQFIKKYFEDLESLFKNELNDQITGKSFENYMDLLNQSWNEHRDVVYEMEKSVVDEYKNKKDN